MPGVFLSYSRADRALADQVIRGLRSLGVEVWWDEDMPGVNWQRELARQIDQLAAVVVLWTPASVASDNVADEARLGKNKKKLINAISGVSAPPFPFDAINALPLDGWTGREPHNGWTRLIKTVEDHLFLGGAETGALSRALLGREEAVRTRRREVMDAEETYQAAKSEEGAASTAEADAAEALQAAEEQLRWVVDKHGSATLVRAAQSDLEAALAAKSVAEQALRDAAGALATAARAMTRAKIALDRLFDEAAAPIAPAPMSAGAAPSPARLAAEVGGSAAETAAPVVARAPPSKPPPKADVASPRAEPLAAARASPARPTTQAPSAPTRPTPSPPAGAAPPTAPATESPASTRRGIFALLLIIGAVLLGCIWAAEDQSHASSAAASNALPDANAAAPDANAATDANATSN